MKTFILTALLAFFVQPAYADDCIEEAKELIEEGGKDVVAAYTKYQANQSLSADDLNISEETLEELEEYIEDGCAKEHLTKAAGAGSALGGMF